MYTRRYQEALTHLDIRKLLEAERVSKRLRKQLNTLVTLHPKFLRDYPEDVGKWVQDQLNNLRIWCKRARFGYFAVWVRENSVGERQEHLHVLLHVPAGKRLSLEQALRRWLPGDDRVVDVRVAEFESDPFGRKINTALTYSFKQMTPKAHWGLKQRGLYARRQVRSRSGLLVAPVLGKRCGISRSLREATGGKASRPLEGIVFRDRSEDPDQRGRWSGLPPLQTQPHTSLEGR